MALLQAQSLVARGAPGKARETMRAWAADGSRPVLLLSAQLALTEVTAVTPDSAELKARASELQTWVALHTDDSLAWGALGQTWARLGLPLRAIDAQRRQIAIDHGAAR